jgi:hypothetical protein
VTDQQKEQKRRIFACRVYVDTPEVVEEIAKEFGCLRINGDGVVSGAAGVLLDRIADGSIRLVRA